MSSLKTLLPEHGSGAALADDSPAGGRKYWRSLDRLLDSQEVREQLAQTGDGAEFPAGASETPDELSRRSMLTLMGASFAMAGLAGCRRPVEKIVPYVTAPEHVIPGIPKAYATTVPFGTSAYGVVVESHEGRPSKIEGNELHPSSLGAATAWMQASVLELYDPDRSRQVMRLPADEPDHRPSAWPDFEAEWQTWNEALAANGGQGLAVLTSSYASPTQARLAAELRQRYPEARWVVYEPIGDENIFAGLEQATGIACRPVYHLERAKKIVALDADFLLTESESLVNAHGFAKGRKVASPDDDMSRLYAVGSTLTATGATADHRVRLESRQVAAFAAALASALGVPCGWSTAGLPPAAAGRAKVIAADLQASLGEALVIAGRNQPAAVHALALAINQALGAVGTTVTLHALEDVGYGTAAGLGELVEAMRDGAVDTLVLLGGNPAYDAPADLGFAAALASVAHTVHLSSHLDETSRLVDWHLPQSHYLETWGDARAAGGSRSVVQPLIAPLHDSRSAVEVLGLLLGGAHRPGHELVRETWQQILTGDFEKDWRRLLHDGIAAEDDAPALEVAADLAQVESPQAAGDGLEITFQPSLTSWDGRFANLGWLQELPDAITKITWDNAAILSPATASEFGVKSGERVRIAAHGAEVEAPVFVLPGQADGSVALALGYGRTAAGRVGDDVGTDAYKLRRSAAPSFDGGIEVSKVAGSHLLAQTQEHWTMDERPLKAAGDEDPEEPSSRHHIREATLDKYREHHGDLDHLFGKHRKNDPEGSHQLYDSHSYAEGYQWGMAIDLNSCIGCNACIVACQSENNIPIVGKEQVSRGREMHWLRVDRYFSGGEAEPEVTFQPVPCMHCENAPCEEVCPVAATVHDREGINAMVYNRCIGTRYCSNNCPYKVRRFNFFNYTKDTPELMKMAMNPDVTVRSRGVMEKCSYCLQRVTEAKKTAKMEGREVRDGEADTACQQTCPTSAIVFGNLRDPESEVVRWKALDRDYVVLADLNNRPRTSYLAKLRNPNPKWS
ncbi:MAG: TAT-variant-translocated molybdopterin oxidoreductase [Thermoanaerobaculia bacterium]